MKMYMFTMSFSVITPVGSEITTYNWPFAKTTEKLPIIYYQYAVCV